MKHFNKLDYTRPTYYKVKKEVNNLINKLNKSNTYKEYISLVRKIIDIQNYIEELYDYIDINNMRNLKDEYYIKELNYWNKYKSKYDLLFIPFYNSLLNSKYKEELSKIIPPNFFNIINSRTRLESNDILELIEKENKLKNDYLKILNKKVLYNNIEVSLSRVSTDYTSYNRDIRKKAHDTINNFYLENTKYLEDIYFNLINTRNSIARSLGFTNYKEYSLYSLKRFGYNYEDINKFRENIIKYIIPLCNKLYTIKKKNLNIDTLKYYDNKCFYKEMPKPLYKEGDLLNKLKLSFSNIDINLSNLYNNMLKYGYIDLVNRENKVNFGITNYLTKTCYPTITGNLKDTYYDLMLVTHELGHAYQKYNASIKDKDYIVSSLLKYPTFDTAEMFSHAMELISIPYLDNIFTTDDYKKYKLLIIHDIITSLPYICLIDEFQEQIYSNPNLTKEDIKTTWLNLAQKYHQDTNNTGHPNLDNGGYFYRQSHLFLNPFYYIDYGLSYLGALSIWDKSLDNLDYFNELASIASYYPLNILIEKYNLPDPFKEESIKDISIKLESELNI